MTDARGEWRVESLPETANSIKITVSRPGFAVEKVAKASKDKGNLWAATEAVLKRRDAHLSGLVRGADGQPVAGSQVLVGSTLATSTSGADGRWKFEALPAGEVEVVAVAPVGVAVASTNAPRDDLPLSLKAPSVAKARDVEGAQAVAEEAWQSSRGTQYGSRPGIAAVLAAADPDAALLLARGDGAKAPQRTISSIVSTILRGGEGGKAEPKTPQRGCREISMLSRTPMRSPKYF
jgi:hypothetical protein